MIDRQNGQRPSSLIVLKNLVKADEVDDQLKEEVSPLHLLPSGCASFLCTLPTSSTRIDIHRMQNQ